VNNDLVIIHLFAYEDGTDRVLVNLVIIHLLAMKMEQIECSETSACKIQTPGNHPEENNIQNMAKV
jgi:hypothetical protein